MRKRQGLTMGALALVTTVGVAAADAQSIGTFRWQLQPYCNVVTLAVTQVGGIYRLEGTDDQCGGAADKASAVGTAFPNPDGTIGFGLTIVVTPGGAPVHVDAALAPGGFDGTWKDSAGDSGTFKFTPGAPTGGQPRPLPIGGTNPSGVTFGKGGYIVAPGSAGSPLPQTGLRHMMLWHAGKSAFRAGYYGNSEWADANIGYYSAALGNSTTASADNSTALGVETTASGGASTATGSKTLASGPHSFAGGLMSQATGRAAMAAGEGAKADGAASAAFGTRSNASGTSAFAAGQETVASGAASTAFGERSYALGSHAIAGGYLASAGGDFSVVLGANAAATAAARGSFVFGDLSTPQNFLASTNPNEFVGRFAGGYHLFSNAALTTGVRVAPGANAWSSLSDVNSKEHFRDLDHDDVLAKIAAMPVREWNYKSQDAAIRHMGPTAQDFRAAFGLGEDPLRISTIDADGVALAAIRALEWRTRTGDEAARSEIEALKAEVAALRATVAALAGQQR